MGTISPRRMIITEDNIESWKEYMTRQELSDATIKKYLHDLRYFMKLQKGMAISREAVINYKEKLKNDYAPRSVNSMLIALNRFFEYMGWQGLKVRTIRLQTRTFCSEKTELSRKDYEKLVFAASKLKKERLEYILQTICCTGIRVSELKFITVEAVMNGRALVTSKGKTREVFIVKKLQQKLLYYIRINKISAGSVFVTRTGKPVCRSNIWKEMKGLCREAGVDRRKVYPHNLRHLFARVFYSIHKDIAKLSDILGHSSIDTTRIYIISSGAEHRKFMERMHLIT